MVDLVEELGSDGYVCRTARFGDATSPVILRVSARSAPREGQELCVVPRPRTLHLFSARACASRPEP
jgi:hypothetical protein